MDGDRLFGVFGVTGEAVQELLVGDFKHRLPDDGLELFKDALFNVFLEFPGDGEDDVLVVFALVEGVVREGNEEPVLAFDDAEPANRELVVQGDGCQGLHAAQGHVGKRENLHAGYFQAGVGLFFFGVGVLCSHGFISCFGC